MSLPDSIKKPVEYTQKLRLHLNGGRKFSEIQFDIFADGVLIGSRVTRTDGSPKYMKTLDQIMIGDESFDVLATKGRGMTEWLMKHTPAGDAP